MESKLHVKHFRDLEIENQAIGVWAIDCKERI
jgi:hypothetical protein